MLEPGSTFGGYRIDGVIGRGGMGVVYEATQLSLGRRLALKVVAAELATDADFRERFRREGAIQARIDHPHIVPVHEAGEHEGHLFIAMRLVPGGDLEDLMARGPVGVERAVTLLGPIADALDSAHEAGLVHRDVKPQNILVDPRGRAFLADFGLTKATGDAGLTRTGHIVGTLNYISPEQVRGKPAGPASDVYALAAVLFELLTGRAPFARDSDAATMYAHVNDPVPAASASRVELGPVVDAALAAGLAKAPEDRPATATALIERLGTGQSAGPGPVADATRHRPGRSDPTPVTLRTPAATEPSAVDDPAQAAATPQAGEPADATRQAGPPALADATRQAGAPAATRLVGPPPHDATAESSPTVVRPHDPARPPGRRRGLLAGAAVGLVALVVAGVLVLGGGDDDGGAPAGDAGARSIAGQGVALSVPGAWTVQRRPELDGLTLQDTTEVRGPRAGTGVLAARLPEAQGPDLLPDAFAAHLGAGPAVDTVTVGTTRALRYRDLRQADPPLALTVYAEQTQDTVVALLCFAPTQAALTALAPDCDRAARSLRVRGAIDLKAEPALEARLKTALADLEDSAVPLRSSLAQASTPTATSDAGKALRDLYAQTANTVDQPPLAPQASDSVARLAEALRNVADAYDHMAIAARAGDDAGYKVNEGKLKDFRVDEGSALGELERLGYNTT